MKVKNKIQDKSNERLLALVKQIEKTMEKATFVALPDIDDIYQSHNQAKEIATSLI